MHRRRFLNTALATAASSCLLSRSAFAEEAPKSKSLVKIRPLTKGPKYHFFGYYDKFEFDVTGRYVLSNEVDFKGRSPEADDVIRVGMVDTSDGDKWIELGTSKAWNWQQGCMLQWIPGADTKVLWNDRDGDRFICRILDVATREQRVIPHPIYTLHPDGRSAICIDYRRLRNFRHDTGYAGVADPFADQLAPEESGIWRIDLESGDERLILSFAEVAKFGEVTDEMRNSPHWIECLAFNPGASRFAFLDRWRPGGTKGFRTRMITASPEGKDLFAIDPSGATSHIAWRDPQHILAFTRPRGKGYKSSRFFLLRDLDGSATVVGEDAMTENGHCTYLSGGEWILNDTYPDKDRLQHPYLYHVATNTRVPLGHFYSPPEYTGTVRCDTHPRISRDGKSVVIDSPHVGNGRQLYQLDISGIVG